MPHRIVIFSGGRLGDWALHTIQPGDMLIGADSGALFLIRHGYRPDLAIGDFDSVSEEQFKLIKASSLATEAYDPIDKDYTDTELALIKAISLQPDEVVITGGLGSRMDHSLANIHLLVRAIEWDIPCSITDEFNEIRLVKEQLTIRKSRFESVSLLPLTPEVKGIRLSGFRYPLHDATLTMGQSLGISNVLESERGTISVREGRLLVIQSSDE
ncbi:thiamine diphosphokinase [Paenibacillus tarimensis]